MYLSSLKNVLVIFLILTDFICIILNEKTPNLYKLCTDIFNLYQNNKDFILFILRLYVYSCVVVYVFT